MSGALRPFPHVHKKNLQGIWFWIVGRLVDFEGSERSRRDLFLRHSRVTCLELLKKVKKILGWNAVCWFFLFFIKTTANELTNCIVQNPSWKSDKFSCRQEIPRTLPHSQEPASCLYPEPGESNPCPHPTSWLSILILSSLLRLGLTINVFPWGFPTKTLYAPFLHACYMPRPSY